MKNDRRILIYGLILCLALFGSSSCSGVPASPTPSILPAAQSKTAPASALLPASVSVEQAYAMVKNGAFVLDVRTQTEWDEYHIQGATLIPLDQLPQRLNEVPRDRDSLVVCRSGGRSQSARNILIQNGFTRVTSLSGGLTAWSAMHYPLVGNAP